MQGTNNTDDFDFEYWAGMAEKDPETFESMRKKCLQELIEQAPEHVKHRMEGLQWQIDQERARSANPMAACLRISQMMWNSVMGERGLLQALETPEKLMRPKSDSGPDNILHLKGNNEL
jgi:Protein of unknown function (DUF3135)